MRPNCGQVDERQLGRERHVTFGHHLARRLAAEDRRTLELIRTDVLALLPDAKRSALYPFNLVLDQPVFGMQAGDVLSMISSHADMRLKQLV